MTFTIEICIKTRSRTFWIWTFANFPVYIYTRMYIHSDSFDQNNSQYFEKLQIVVVKCSTKFQMFDEESRLRQMESGDRAIKFILNNFERVIWLISALRTITLTEKKTARHGIKIERSHFVSNIRCTSCTYFGSSLSFSLCLVTWNLDWTIEPGQGCIYRSSVIRHVEILRFCRRCKLPAIKPELCFSLFRNECLRELFLWPKSWKNSGNGTTKDVIFFLIHYRSFTTLISTKWMLNSSAYILLSRKKILERSFATKRTVFSIVTVYYSETCCSY